MEEISVLSFDEKRSAVGVPDIVGSPRCITRLRRENTLAPGDFAFNNGPPTSRLYISVLT